MVVPVRCKFSVLIDIDMKELAEAFDIPPLWMPRERTPTITEGEMAIHVDNLRMGLRFPLHPFRMKYLMDN